MSESLQQLRDEIGSEPDTASIFKVKKEKIKINELSTRVSTRTIGNSFVLGHAINGTLGDENDNVLGDDRTTAVVERVVNPNNTFKEYFRTDTFEASATTADWDVTNHDLEITDGEVAQSEEIYLNNDIIYTATITLTSDDPISGLQIYLSADGGSNWESVTDSTKHTFTDTGTDLRFKITNEADSFPKSFPITFASGETVTITKIKVTYN